MVAVKLPLPCNPFFHSPVAVRYVNGRLTDSRKLPAVLSFPFAIDDNEIRRDKTYLRLKLRDILAIFWFVLFWRGKYELFIGVESVAAIIGGILKKMGLVNKTVYYISDWSPVRYKNPVLNWLYIKTDLLACRWSDFIWNYTYTISEARRDILQFDMDKIGKELWVPFGFIPDGVTLPDEKDIDRRRMVFCGGLGPENGVDLIIESLPLVKEQIPDIKIDIFGSGSEGENLKRGAEDLDVTDCITWHGYVSDRKEILSHYLRASISLAPYAPLENSVKKYGDVMKIRDSIGCGLPVITTTVPPSHKEVQEKMLGEVIDFTSQALSAAIIRLLTNDEYYFAMRRRVIAASKEGLWENIYGRTLDAMGYDTSVIYSKGDEH